MARRVRGDWQPPCTLPHRCTEVVEPNIHVPARKIDDCLCIVLWNRIERSKPPIKHSPNYASRAEFGQYLMCFFTPFDSVPQQAPRKDTFVRSYDSCSYYTSAGRSCPLPKKRRAGVRPECEENIHRNSSTKCRITLQQKKTNGSYSRNVRFLTSRAASKVHRTPNWYYHYFTANARCPS